VKITDNFLDKETFKSIQNLILNDTFDWYYAKAVTSEKLIRNEFQFIHIFYQFGKPRKSYCVIEPIIQKINLFSLVRAKANLLTITPKIKQFDFHTDFDDKENLTTAILYLNTCNGYTIFKDGTKVESFANRFVEFDSKLEHTGTTCTDENVRVVINFNYFKL
jgi:hypothetical protein|tara:strand:- start:150 stop:638 length:489 start_codon:yes stop_codon:yes gene_type:complete